ncbi:hypothetical protein K5M56_25820, partial [Serratia marcescens]|nr:hypothetical protein [Serratia marcescens]
STTLRVERCRGELHLSASLHRFGRFRARIACHFFSGVFHPGAVGERRAGFQAVLSGNNYDRYCAAASVY